MKNVATPLKFVDPWDSVIISLPGGILQITLDSSAQP